MLGLCIQSAEQALFKLGQAQPDNWDDPDLVSGKSSASFRQSTDPFARHEPGELV
jgi:hypothetical protein